MLQYKKIRKVVPFVGESGQYSFIVKETGELVVCRGKESERRVALNGSVVDMSDNGIAVVKVGDEHKIAYVSVDNVESSCFVELTDQSATA